MAKDEDDGGIAWSDDLTQWVKTESTVSISYADMKFFDRDVSESARILSQAVVSKTTNPDGSWRTESTTTEYGYNGPTGKLSSMKTYSTANGLNPNWFEYTDKSGNLLTVRTTSSGTREYYYVDSTTNKEVIIDAADVTTTEKTGTGYKESSTTTYAIYNNDTPLPEATTSVTETYGTDNTTVAYVTTRNVSYTNELIDRSKNGLNNKNYRTTTSTETRETWSKILDPDRKYLTARTTTTTNTFDDNGFLEGVSGSATETGWNYSASAGFSKQYDSTATMEYEVVLGKALLKDTKETRTYRKSGSSESTSPDTSKKIDFSSYTDSAALMSKAWEYYNSGDYENAIAFIKELISRYEDEAEEQQESLEDYAASGKESDYWALNDVGTAYYVLGQIYKQQADEETDADKKDDLLDKAKENFNIVIDTLGFAQCWDTNGWYWKVAEGATKLLKTL
jgi:tetratricopeptide (TPR) repeat protein